MSSLDPSMSGFRSPPGVMMPNNEDKNPEIGAFGPLSTSDATILSTESMKNNIDDYIGLNYFNYPLDHSGSNIRAQKTVTYIQALADMLVCPNTTFPVSVGLFSRVGAGIKTTHLEKLSTELARLTKINNQRALRPSCLLFMFPAFIFIVIGIIVGLGTNWIVGVSVGASLSLLSFLFIEIVIFGSSHNRWNRALKAAQWLAGFTQSLQLFLDILFRYPHETEMSNKPLSVIITHHNLSGYSSASHMTLYIVEKLWKAIEDKYGCVLTRLQHSCKDTDSSDRFKRFCCIPIFVLVIIFLVAVIVNLTLFTVYNHEPLTIFTNRAILPVFVIMTCIIFLCIFGTLPLLCRTIAILTRSPARLLKQMLESPNIDCQVSDTLVKSELIKLCQIISIFECYLKVEKVRMIVLIDASDVSTREKLANSIYLINSLLQSSSNAPVALIFAADFHTLMTEWMDSSSNFTGIKPNFFQEFSDNFHLIHSTIHLPIYMEDGIDFHRSGSGKKKFASNGMFCMRGGNSFESLNMIQTGNKQNAMPITARKTSIYQTALTGDFMGKGSWKTVQQLFLARGELLEINNKMIKQLTATAAFIGRLLRINLVEFKLEHLISWLSLSINWPYHTALITLFLEEQYSGLTSKHNLLNIFELVLSKVNSKENLPTDVDLLQRDDKDFTKLENFIKKEVGTTMAINTLKYFISWSPFMNPYLRFILRDYLINKNISQTRASRNQLTSPPLTNINLSEQSDAPVDDDLPRPVVSPTNQLANQIAAWSKNSVANLVTRGDRPKTPIAIKRCMVKLKDGYPGKDLSQLDKHEIGVLMSQIEGLSSDENTEKYKEKLIYLNVTGLVLSVCDMDQLQLEMEMTFGDWQLFKTLINHLRAVEAFKSEDVCLGTEPYNDHNAFWNEADIDGDSEEDDEIIGQNAKIIKHHHRKPKNTITKSRSQMNSLKTAGKRSEGTKVKQLPQQTTYKATTNNSHRKQSLNYNKTNYIYSPLATDDNVISNSYSVESEKLSHSHPPVPSHRTHTNTTHKHSFNDSEALAFLIKDSVKQKTGSNVSLGVNERKKPKNSFRSLSQSQERIHLVRARTCPSTNMDRCATYIPVLLQTSLGGCMDIGDQECTCDYWFRIEHQNGICHKTVTSEPASRVQSRPQTSPEGSDEEENPRTTAYWPESVKKSQFNGSAV